MTVLSSTFNYVCAISCRDGTRSRIKHMVYAFVVFDVSSRLYTVATMVVVGTHQKLQALVWFSI